MHTNTFKNILAVVVGFLTVVVLSTGTDKILEALGIFPPPSEAGLFVTWMLILAFIYRSVYTVFAGYVTAHLSIDNRMLNVKILGIMGTLGGIGGIVAGWDLSPHWYPIALAITAYPLVRYGGALKK